MDDDRRYAVKSGGRWCYGWCWQDQHRLKWHKPENVGRSRLRTIQFLNTWLAFFDDPEMGPQSRVYVQSHTGSGAQFVLHWWMEGSYSLVLHWRSHSVLPLFFLVSDALLNWRPINFSSFTLSRGFQTSYSVCETDCRTLDLSIKAVVQYVYDGTTRDLMIDPITGSEHRYCPIPWSDLTWAAVEHASRTLSRFQAENTQFKDVCSGDIVRMLGRQNPASINAASWGSLPKSSSCGILT